MPLSLGCYLNRMVYQLSEFILPYILGIDLFLIALLYLSKLPDERITRRFILAAALAGFAGLSFFKLLFTETGIAASTPVSIEFINKDLPAPVYFIKDGREGKRVFWKDSLPKGATTHTFEQEGNPDLTLATKFDGEWHYTTINLRQVLKVTVEKPAFKKVDQPEVEQAISKYRWIETGNYASNFLVVGFVAILVWRLKKTRKTVMLKV
ncbi:hypothetical protein C8N40_104191 [Pontibacter mucosus]|uniref:Uncharacterized protein n=1 Tax=Pontibacter mucosus TaxID=1649266 RepID=A0A2T5YJG8_9BACT|nr:hypothetical protein [Pontibacter mucosus]PTX19459.1 hypothetical protein C8N40_104191 [Pontibacter mucosus]